MRCASYTRAVSVADLGEVPGNIIAIQNERIAAYIKKRHWHLAVKYSDRKKNAEEEKAFLAMKDGAIARDFDCLVMDSLFRCGKNAVVAAEVIKNMLLPAGIHFAVVEDDFCSADVTKEEAAAYLDQKQSEFRNSRIIRGIRRALNNRVYEKYGYLHKDGRMELVIDPETEQCIKRIYELVCQGHIFAEVARVLNAEGYESRRQHLMRLRNQAVPVDGIPWDSKQVSTVVRSRLYIGEWERTVDGEKKIYHCPPIVSVEVFDRAKKAAGENGTCFSGRKKKPKPNPYAKRVFDLETGCALKLGVHQGLHIKVYRFQYPKPADVNYGKTYISWEELDRLARVEIEKECRRAKQAAGILDSDGIAGMKRARIQEEREKAQVLFSQMTAAENQQVSLYRKYKSGMLDQDEYGKARSELLLKIKELDTVFAEHMDEVSRIEAAYSKNNPWIKLFEDWKIPTEFGEADGGKIIRRVECERFEKVRIRFVHEEWKSYFPDRLWQEE